MVNGFEEEVKALEEYGHDCCARIDDRIHECCKRIREAHEQELDNTRYAYETSLTLMKKQPSPVAYDVLGNERHEAVCELRKLPDGYPGYSMFPFAKWYKDLSLALGIGGSELSCARVRDTLIHLLGGDQMPVTLGDLHGILKGDGDGVDTGGRDEAGSAYADASSPQCACSGRCGGLAEEIAPITTELRDYLSEVDENLHEDWLFVNVEWSEVNRLCDNIDAIHASLERELKFAKADAKTQRNNFDQATSAREHWKSLYEQSLEHIHDLEHDVEMWRDRAEDMRMERDDALKEHHEWAPESHYMMLPKDADGVPVHIGDVMEWPDTSTSEVVGVYENGFFYVEGDDDIAAEWTSAYNKVHHAPETVEGVLREFALAVCKDDALTIRRGVVEEFAKRLTLAGDAE